LPPDLRIIGVDVAPDPVLLSDVKRRIAVDDV
jgi:hypothetical protein